MEKIVLTLLRIKEEILSYNILFPTNHPTFVSHLDWNGLERTDSKKMKRKRRRKKVWKGGAKGLLSQSVIAPGVQSSAVTRKAGPYSKLERNIRSAKFHDSPDPARVQTLPRTDHHIREAHISMFGELLATLRFLSKFAQV
ncbi:hypothetical protein J6590_097508 [Homalodisca vitripennis]|nr:hypothetical protein J6590_077709 [Homalodisca vitripennis]KAG8289777.1 hypothetical protein J6590_097508 [Homalodisca vitripennis]